ncbi:MAG: sulfatase-like hydrolase/transferase [Gemmataceae bacterium]|nr:sulfatase-like hydrolase/transferase [Gemmataceae bacterium]
MSGLTRREAMGALAGAAAPRRPNVLFLISDEHSPHVAGCFGNRTVRTPWLDSIAAGGTAFDAAYTQNPICTPSRASFLTGRMASNVGVFGNVHGTLDDTVPTMADVFLQAGYAAGWMGKTHWGGDPKFETPRPSKKAGAAAERRGARSRLPEDAAIAAWPESEEVDSYATGQALEFLEQRRAKPFFLGVSWRKPHFPFLVQQRFASLYEGKVAAPRVTARMIGELPAISREEREKYGFARLSEAQIRRALEIYYGMVTYMDEQIGAMLKKLDALGLRENTIVLYTSDHGEMGGEHGLWYKNSFYEASARIPMAWSWPKAIRRGARIGAPAMNLDILPTLCELCGLDKPAGLEGRSLAGLLAGREDGRDRYALSENYRGSAAGRMIRRGQWKFCHYKDDRDQLFDLSQDPGEETNLAGRAEHKALASQLKEQALRGWRLDKLEAYRKKARAARKAGATDEP